MQEEHFHNNDYDTLKTELIKMFTRKNIIVIGISKNNSFKAIKSLINKASGVVLPGGNKYTKKDLKIAKYLRLINKPTLGICQGMQVMCMANNGIIHKKALNNHYSNNLYHHEISIIKNTLLSKIINKNIINVNSRHFDEILSTDLEVCAYSNDYVIEAVADNNCKFYLGVQWHPESNYHYLYNDLIINYFIKSMIE